MDAHNPETGEIVAPLSSSPEFGKLAEALAKAQGAFTNPKRDRTVKVATKTGGSYEFQYATLGAVLDAIRKPLAENGISYTHTLTERAGKYRLVTRLMHASGQWIESETPLFVSENSNQAFGSALTYMKRYALSALLGVSADEDDDANAADGNSAEKKDRAIPANSAKATTRKPAPPQDPNVMAARDKFTALRNLIKSETDAEGLDRLYDGHSDDRKFIAEHGGEEAAKQLDRLYRDRRELLTQGLAA